MSLKIWRGLNGLGFEDVLDSLVFDCQAFVQSNTLRRRTTAATEVVFSSKAKSQFVGLFFTGFVDKLKIQKKNPQQRFHEILVG